MIDSLLNDLRSPSVAVVEQAIQQLGASGESRAVAPLVRSLHTFKNQAELKSLICDALGELGDLRATQALLSHLRDPDDEVREAAFTALFDMGQRRAHAMPDANQWEQGFADPTAALTQIAWQTDHEAVLLLLRALDGHDQQVKIGALYTLGQLGFIGALDHVEHALQDPHDEISSAAAYALGELARLSSDRVAQRICSTLYTTWHHLMNAQANDRIDTQIQIIRAMSECTHLGRVLPEAQANEAAQLYVSALNHPEHVIRQLAVIGLGRLGDPRALSILCERLLDPETGVRRNAAYAIGTLQCEEGPMHLVNYAVGQPSEVRVAIVWAMSRASREASLYALRQGLSDHSAQQRAVSAHLAGQLAFSSELTTALNDPAWEVRKNAALAVGDARARSLASHLFHLTQDQVWQVRAASVEGLKRLGDPSCLTLLKQQLSQEKHSVVANALRAAIKSLSST